MRVEGAGEKGISIFPAGDRAMSDLSGQNGSQPSLVRMPDCGIRQLRSATTSGLPCRPRHCIVDCTRYLVVLVGAGSSAPGALASALSARHCIHLPLHPSILNAPTVSTFQTGTPSSGTERGACASTGTAYLLASSTAGTEPCTVPRPSHSLPTARKEKNDSGALTDDQRLCGPRRVRF